MIAECRAVVASDQPAQPAEFALQIERLALHYPENRLTPQEQKLVLSDWRRLLGHLPADILWDAVDAYVMSPARFFPTPGQLFALAEQPLKYRQALARRAASTLELMEQAEREAVAA